MPAAFGPRFVLEAGFLVLLAVAVALAELDPVFIVLVMALGWLLVSLIEYFAWQQAPAFPTAQGATTAGELPPSAFLEERSDEPTPPPPSPPEAPAPPPPPEEETAVEPAAKPDEPASAADEPGSERTDFLADPERHLRHRLEPLQPRPRRRWLLFGRREREEGSKASADEPSAPAGGAREEGE